MGTRRSKHNFGRKPLYKEVERESVRHGFAEERPEREQFISDVRHEGWKIPRPDPVLTAQVVAYLAKRKAMEAPTPNLKRPVEHNDLTDFEPAVADTDQRRDLLLQMFSERRICGRQLAAGRMWQHYMEDSMLQPAFSIDPSAPLSKQYWQRDGDLNERQHSAHNIRRIALSALGHRRMAFLDLILDGAVTRADAMRLSGLSGNRLMYVVGWLLEALAIYFTYRTGPDEGPLAAFTAASEKYVRFKDAKTFAMDNVDNIDRMKRKLMRLERIPV